MPIIKSAVKRMHQTAKRRDRNVGIKKDIKSAVKAFVAEPSALTLAKAQSELDKAVKKGLIKKNTAARRKSALSAAAKKSGVKPEVKKAAKPVTKTTEKKSSVKKPTAKKTTAKKAEK